MASASRVRAGLTLEEFLRLPGIEEPPGLEYRDGLIEAKAMPQEFHAILQGELTAALNRFARPNRLGYAFPELRCTFAGRSILPDIAFLKREHIRFDDRGRPLEETPIPPDIHVEILSPDGHAKKSRAKLDHSAANGSALGWLIDPEREAAHVYRPGQPPELLPPDGVLDGGPVLPGFRLPVAEVFGWLILDL